MAKAKSAKKPLLFVDTNIWLDLYRQRKSDVALEVLKKLESAQENIIVTYVLDMEYRKSRQQAIAEGLKALAAPPKIATHGIFSESKETEAIEGSLEKISTRLTKLRARLLKALQDPTRHDTVYKTCQRVFHRNDELVLDDRTDKAVRSMIRNRALRRFFLGCPPRKASDLSIGDAVNWEWMLYCAEKRNTDLVILTRDADYGITVEAKPVLNDYLLQEFKEKVNMRGKVHLCDQSKVALAHLSVKVSAEAEEDVSPPGAVQNLTITPGTGQLDFASALQRVQENIRKLQADLASSFEKMDSSKTESPAALPQMPEETIG